jgi:hypothetical protein
MFLDRAVRFFMGLVWVILALVIYWSEFPIDNGFLGCIIIANVWFASQRGT